jgi:selenocysteine lyase/cysteine desulfurase
VPGFRTDLQSISAIAREAGALFLVDGVQSCGILRVDVEDLGIDALATSTSKGLLGLRGLGFLYVRQNWIERLHPAYVARNSFETGARHYSEYEGTDVVLKASAQRFECGNYNYTGVAVANAAMTDILKIGTSAIEARAVSLAASLAEALRRMGFVVNTPPHGTALTHLVTLRDPQLTASQSAVSGRLDIFSRELSAANVRFAVRRGMIRFGFHLYNDETDVEVVSAVAAKTIRAAA